MKLIHLTWSVLISIYACAQNTENLLKNHFNPVFSEELKTIKFYSQINIINPEFGIHNSKSHIFFKVQKRSYQLGYEQYGYKLFKDSEYIISSNQKLNRRTNLGLSMNLHHLKVYETEKHTAISQMNYMHYTDRDKIGSGNEQTNEPYKSEISLYLKWKN